MTLNQYCTLSKTIADKIVKLGGDPNRVRHLASNASIEIQARDPKLNEKTGMRSGDANATITFNEISNPNNPNYMFKTLKPGSISMYDGNTHTNVDATLFNFDTCQFANLIAAVNEDCWTIK